MPEPAAASAATNTPKTRVPGDSRYPTYDLNSCLGLAKKVKNDGGNACTAEQIGALLGYKSVKYLSHITVTDSMKNIGDGQGSPSPAAGYSWYAGI